MSNPPITESDKSIDELLVDLRQGRDFYKMYPEIPLDYEVRTAKDQLYSLLMDVIGEDEPIVNVTLTLTEDIKLYLTDNKGEIEQTRNHLRQEQRTKLNELFKGDKDG